LIPAGRFDVVERHAGAAPGDLAFGGEDAGGVHLWTVQPLAGIDRQAERKRGEEANRYGDEVAGQEDVDQVLAF